MRWLIPLALLVRVVFVMGLTAGLDIINFTDSARYFADGRNIFEVQYYWNYSPVLGVLIVPIAHAPDYALAHRLLLTVFDAMNAVLLWQIVGRRAGLIYWCSPAGWLLIAVHGQFEAAAMAPVLLALLCLRVGSRHCLSSTSQRRSYS